VKRAALPAILLVSLLLSAWFAVSIRFGTNPDERGHRDYIRLLISHHGPIAFTPFTEDEKAKMAEAANPNDSPYDRSETHQPPLYYLLCIPVQLLSGGDFVAVRLVAAVIQLVTIVLCWYAVRDLFPERPDLALGVAALVAFLPTQARLSGAINNDCLATLLCAAFCWRLGALAARRQTVRDAIILGVIFGVGLLTKSTILQLVPGMLFAYGIAVRGRLLSIQEALLRGGIAFGVGFLLASPWLIRNMSLYGDPLALSIYRATGPNFTPQLIMDTLHWSFADYARNTGTLSFTTFWYMLPPNLLQVPLPLLVILLVLAGGGVLGTYRWATRTQDADAPRRALAALALAAAFLVPFFVQFLLTVFQAQGRYFLPGLLPIALVTMLGWGTLVTPRWPAVGQAGVAVLLLGLTISQLL